MKLLIAGSRDITDYQILLDTVKKVPSFFDGVTNIISGKARGADALGERYANRNDLPLLQYPANWDTHGKAAGYIRNKQMVEVADRCLVLWDGSSKGSLHTINLALNKGIPLFVIYVDSGVPERIVGYNTKHFDIIS